MLTHTRLGSALLIGLSTLALQGCAAASSDAPDSGEDANPSRSDALSMPACGAVLASFDGTDAYSNAGDTASGNSCAGWGTYGLQYQCVELVQRHFKTHWGLHWSGNAKDLLNNAPKAQVDVHANGDAAHPPVPGDMIVWPNGSWGHVALVTSVYAGGIDVIEQNVKGSGKATLSWDGAHIGPRWGNWTPSGWAHAKANGAPPVDPGPSSSSSSSGGGNSSSSSSSGGNSSSSSSSGGNSSSSGSPAVSWNCGNSSYQGQQFWTCSNGDIYECQNGVAEVQKCANGCQSNPVGTDDACKSAAPPPVSWSCGNSSYQGAQYWTCSGGNIFKCQGGVPEEKTCANGCQSKPLGTDDVCL